MIQEILLTKFIKWWSLSYRKKTQRMLFEVIKKTKTIWVIFERFFFSIITYKNSRLNRFILKIEVKVTEYNIHSGSIRWQISTSIKSYLRIFASNHHFRLTFEILWTWKCRSRSRCTTFHNDAIRWQIHDFVSEGNSNVSSISHRLWDITFLQTCNAWTHTGTSIHAHTQTRTPRWDRDAD